MGRILPYIMENKKCLKPPTRKTNKVSVGICGKHMEEHPTDREW
jgi:hypothetical protein